MVGCKPLQMIGMLKTATLELTFHRFQSLVRLIEVRLGKQIPRFSFFYVRY